MTYPFKFSEFGDPALTFGRRREWGPLAATEVHATPGRYPGAVMPDHRVIFYLTPSVPTDCACEGVRQRRFGSVVRISVNDAMPSAIRELLIENLEVDRNDVYAVNGPLGLASLQLLPGSPFLRELGETPLPRGVDVVSVGALRDWLAPVASTVLEGVRSIALPTGHSGLLVDEQVADAVAQLLREPAAPPPTGASVDGPPRSP